MENTNATREALKAAGFDPDATPKSKVMVNKALAALGHPEVLFRGEGYWYFGEGNAAGWWSSSVGVYRITDMPLIRWIEARNSLANDPRNF